jgi:2-methylcitrate dehydratase PrpD
MAPLQRAGVTGDLVDWVHGLTFADLPARVVERAKHLLLDGVGTAMVGAQLPWSRVATSAVLGLEGRGDSVIIGTGRTAAAPPAVLPNSTFVQGFELDDFHPLAPLHSGSLIIPARLAGAQRRPSGSGVISGADALTAAVVGFEVGPRVGLALHGAQMLSRGWHSGAVFGTHPAAMTTGKLRHLNPAQLEDALGMAGTQSGGLMAAQFEAMSKRMQHAVAVALLDGQVLPAQFTPDRLDADDVWALIDRVAVRHDRGIDTGPARERFTTDLDITLDDGTRLRRRLAQPHGGPADPVGNAEIVDKFRHLTAPCLSAGRLEAVRNAVLDLDHADDLDELIDLLAPPVLGVLD